MALFRCLARQFKALSAPTPAFSAAQVAGPVQRAGVSSPMLNMTLSPLFPQLQVREMGYKLKTKSAVKKRFTVNSNGTVKRAQANKRHIATKKTRERIRRLGKPVYMEGKIRKNILNMLHN